MPETLKRPAEYTPPRPVDEDPLITDELTALVAWTCSKVVTDVEEIDRMQDDVESKR